jgi:integrase
VTAAIREVSLRLPRSDRELKVSSRGARNPIAKYGHGKRAVRVFTEAGYVRVMWRERGARRYQSWPDTKDFRREAKAYAEGLSDTLGKPKETPTLTARQLWDRYREIGFPHLRPNTRRLYETRWAKWELFIGANFLPDEVTLEHVDEFRLALTARGMAVNQIREIIKVAKVVHNWGESRELIVRNRLSKYRFKVGKEEPVHEPAEYSADERDRLIAAVNPRLGTQWRPWALLMILGHHGVRETAAVHLRWEDIDYENKEVIWRAEFDKLGREWRQALTWEMVSALMWAAWWRKKFGDTSPWVFFSRDRRNGSRRDGNARPGVYRIQSLWAALTGAEARSGVGHRPYRAAHGLRRMVAGEVLALTGDPVLAMHYIGDTDLKTMKRYLKRRDDRLAVIADSWTQG